MFETRAQHLTFFIVLVLAMPAFAAGPGLTYHGRLLKPDGTPVAASVSFRIQVRSPGAEDCLLYEETQTQDLTTTAGVFVLGINDGSGSRTDGGSQSFEDAFSNRIPLTLGAGKCTSGTVYTPTASDARALRVSFNDGTFVGWEDTPLQAINYAPKAIDALQIAGFPVTSLVRVAESNGTLTPLSPISNANYTELLSLIAGTSTQYLKSSAQGAQLPSLAVAPASPVAGQIWFDSSTGNIKLYDGAATQTLGTSGGSVTSVASGAGLTGGPITTSGTLALATSGVTAGTYPKVTVDVYGRATSGTTLVEADIPTLSTAGKVVGTAITSGAIGGTTSISTSGNITTTGTTTAASVSATNVGTQSVQIFDSTNSHKVTVQAPAPGSLPANYSLTLPTGLPGSTGYVLTTDTSGNLSWVVAATGNGDALVANPLSQFAPTTSAQLAGVLSDETGSGAAVFGTSPTLASPSFTGTPVAPTAAVNTNTTQVATTAYVLAQAGSATPLTDGAAAVGVATKFAREDHVHPTDLSRAPAAGSASITTLGTITTGVWNATSIGLGYGGTGATTAAGARTNLGLGTAATVDTGNLVGQIPILGAAGISGSSMCTGDGAGNIVCNTAVPAAGITALTGDVTGTGPGSTATTIAANAVTTTKIIDGAVTVNKIATMSNNTLLANTSGGAASPSATTLSALVDSAASNAQGSVLYRNNAGWVALAPGTSGQYLQTQGAAADPQWATGNAGTVTGVTATAPVVSSGGAAPVISIAKSTAAVDGYLAAADFTTFNSKLSSALASGSIFVGSAGNVATAVVMSGDVGIASDGTATVNGIKGKSVSAVPTADGQVLRYDGANWTPNYVSMQDLRSTVTGAASVTSCAAGQTLTYTSVADNLACTSIAITDSQVTYASEAQNTFFAAPTGAAGAPTYRTIASTDLPAGGYDTTYFKNGGNAFGAASVIGNSGNFDLTVNTNNLPRVTVRAGGNVGIGTTNPGALLDLGLAGTKLGTMRFEGNTSGYVQLQPAAAAGSWTLTLPATAGTTGQVLTTDGAGVTTWSTAAAGGVTSVATGTGLTGGPITATGTISLASIANNSLLANTSGGAAAPIATTLSAIVDAATSNAQGSILYRNNSGWVALAPGTGGQYLQTQGAAANPQWATVSAGTVTSVTGTAPISVATGTTTPVISIANGTATGQVLRWDGVSAWAKTKLLYTDLVNASAASPWPASCTAGQGLTYSTVLDAFTCVTLTGGASTGIVDGGNSRTAAISIGTNDAYSLGLRTGGADKLTILTSGNVGIGTPTPQTTLEVSGAATVGSSFEGAASYVNTGTAYTIPDTSSNTRRLTLTGNATVTLPAFIAPTTKIYSLTLFLKQDATGSRTITFAGNSSDTVIWDAGVAPTIASSATNVTIVQLVKASDETVWYASMVWRQN